MRQPVGVRQRLRLLRRGHPFPGPRPSRHGRSIAIDNSQSVDHGGRRADTDRRWTRGATGSLWRHRDFMLLWGGQTVSEVGSAVTTLALPSSLLISLHATTFEVGALDRVHERRVPARRVAGRRVGRPVAQEARARVGRPRAGRRSSVRSRWRRRSTPSRSPHLFVAAVLAGALTVFFDVAYQSYLPELLDTDQLVDGNGKIGASQAFGQVAGPSFGGVLVGALGAAYAVVADAASFAVSAVATIAIRHREPSPRASAEGRAPARRDTRGPRVRARPPDTAQGRRRAPGGATSSAAPSSRSSSCSCTRRCTPAPRRHRHRC